jgi:tetratricopeptide (TPR) repeat protein
VGSVRITVEHALVRAKSPLLATCKLPPLPRLLPLLLLLTLSAHAQDSIQLAFDHFYNLEYPESLAIFEQAVTHAPNDPDLQNHIAETLLFQEMFRNGALESELVSGNNSFLRRPKLNPAPETEARFLAAISKAMSLCEARLRANPNDTGAHYALGISYGLRSNYYWLVKKSWRDSLKDATAARREHHRVTELDPSNVDARMIPGLHDYVAGSLPWAFRALAVIVGVHGDKERGIHTVEQVAAKGDRNRTDARILMCALYRRENRPREAIPYIQELIRQFPRNYILRLELSQMYSIAGDKAPALAAVDEIAALKTRHAPGYDRVPWEKIWFQRGIIQFWYREPDAALENLGKVAASSDPVDLSMEAWARLRIAQIHDQRNQRAEAVDWYRKTISFAPQSEAAQEARKYLGSPYHRT